MKGWPKLGIAIVTIFALSGGVWLIAQSVRWPTATRVSPAPGSHTPDKKPSSDQQPEARNDVNTGVAPSIEVITPDGQTLSNQNVIELSGSVELRLRASEQPETVDYYGWDHWNRSQRENFLIGTVQGNESFVWHLTPPQRIELYAVAHYGQNVKRTDTISFLYPLPAQVTCPDVRFPSFEANGHGQVTLVAAEDIQAVRIETPGGDLVFSTAVDPNTCQDSRVRGWLSNLRGTH